MSRKRRQKRETIWVGVEQGYDHERTELFKERDRAREWLQRRWRDEKYDAARTDEYMRRDYAERALSEPDPEMKEYYATKAESPEVQLVSEIDERDSDGFAEFTGRERYFIQERELR
jgi:hypothetical protein